MNTYKVTIEIIDDIFDNGYLFSESVKVKATSDQEAYVLAAPLLAPLVPAECICGDVTIELCPSI